MKMYEKFERNYKKIYGVLETKEKLDAKPSAIAF